MAHYLSDSQLARLRDGQVVGPMTVRVVKAPRGIKAAEEVETPLHAIEVSLVNKVDEDIKKEESGVKKEPGTAAEGATTTAAAFRIDCALVTRPLNQFVLSKQIDEGAIVEITAYEHDATSTQKLVRLKVTELKILKVSDNMTAMLQELLDDADATSSFAAPSTASASASSLSTSPQKKSTKTNIPVATSKGGVGSSSSSSVDRAKNDHLYADLMSDDDDDGDDDDDDETAKDNGGPAARKKRKWTYLHSLRTTSNRWKALVRVQFADNRICKGYYKDANKKGEWSKLPVHFIDGKGHRIGTTLWGDSAAKWGPYLRPGTLVILNSLKVDRIKPDDKFNDNLRIHDHELKLEKDTSRTDFVELVDATMLAEFRASGAVLIPEEFAGVTSLRDLAQLDDKTVVNCVCVVTAMTPVEPRGKHLKRYLQLLDQSGSETRMQIASYVNKFNTPDKAAKELSPIVLGLGNALASFDASKDKQFQMPDGSVDYAKLPIVYLLNASINRYMGELTLDFMPGFQSPTPTCMWVGADGRQFVDGKVVGEKEKEHHDYEDGNGDDYDDGDDGDNGDDNDRDEAMRKRMLRRTLHPQAVELRAWLDNHKGGDQPSITPLCRKHVVKPSDAYGAQRLTLAALKKLEARDKVHVTFKASVEKLIYKDPSEMCAFLCPVVDDQHKRGCYRMLQVKANGSVVCSNPNHGEQRQEADRRTLAVALLVQDSTGTRQIRVEGAMAEKVLGQTAMAMHTLCGANRLDDMEAIADAALGRMWVFWSTANMSTYGDRNEVQTRVVDIVEPDMAREIELVSKALAEFPAPPLVRPESEVAFGIHAPAFNQKQAAEEDLGGFVGSSEWDSSGFIC